MLKIYFAILCGFFLILLSMTTEARTNINLDIGLNPTPPPVPTNVVMLPPEGYSNCYVTQGGWYGNVWVPPHQECSYPSPGGVSLWVSGYWGCLGFGPHGRCDRWRWYGHRWSGPQVGYDAHYYGHYGYGRPYHHRW